MRLLFTDNSLENIRRTMPMPSLRLLARGCLLSLGFFLFYVHTSRADILQDVSFKRDLLQLQNLKHNGKLGVFCQISVCIRVRAKFLV